jgi:MFS family permease
MTVSDLWLRLRALVRHQQVERELHEELAFHVEMQVRRHLAAGLSTAEARRLAHAQFGSTALIEDQVRQPTISQAGLVNNLNDGMAWGLFPLFFAGAHMDLGRIGTLAAIYPATMGFAQLVTGALSDRVGRKWLIAGGMWPQGVGIGVIILSDSFAGFAQGDGLVGIGTAMVYPTLLAAIGDVAQPLWRASAVGEYQLWRDLGYAVGALLAGVTADVVGLAGAMWLIAGVTVASGWWRRCAWTETSRRLAV